MQSRLEQAVLDSPAIRREISALVGEGITERKAFSHARKYLSQMGRDINPASLAFSLWLARRFLRNLDIKVFGNATVFSQMEQGGVALVSSHFSYVDIGILPKVFAERDVSKVYYMGGENVFGVPVLGLPLKLWLTTSGFVPLKRSLIEEREKGRLYKAAVNERSSQLLAKGMNLVNYAGRGRHDTGKIKGVELTATPAILQHATSANPVAITYEIHPEEDLFLLGQPRGRLAGIEFAIESHVRRMAGGKKGATILTAFATAWENAHGVAYVNFGHPLETQAYNASGGQPSGEEIERFHNDLTARVSKLVTLTPNNVFAYAVKLLNGQLKSCHFEPAEIVKQMRLIVSVAERAGMAVSPKLAPETLGQTAREAFGHFGALSLAYAKSPNRKPINPIDFYANQINEPIRLPNAKS